MKKIFCEIWETKSEDEGRVADNRLLFEPSEPHTHLSTRTLAFNERREEKKRDAARALVPGPLLVKAVNHRDAGTQAQRTISNRKKQGGNAPTSQTGPILRLRHVTL